MTFLNPLDGLRALAAYVACQTEPLLSIQALAFVQAARDKIRPGARDLEFLRWVMNKNFNQHDRREINAHCRSCPEWQEWRGPWLAAKVGTTTSLPEGPCATGGPGSS